METINLKRQTTVGGTVLEVETRAAPDDDAISFALQSRIYQEWIAALDPRIDVKRIVIHDVDFKGKPCVEKILFIRMGVTFETPKDKLANAGKAQGDKLQQSYGIAELRGGTSVMDIKLRCEGRLYDVLVKQARIPIGKLDAVEKPAGMLDHGGTFAGVAVNELGDELDLEFNEDDLIDLTKETGPLCFSEGLLDEKARFFLGVRDVSKAELGAMQGKATGLLAENESIVLWIVPSEDTLRCTDDGKAFICAALVAEWEKKGNDLLTVQSM